MPSVQKLEDTILYLKTVQIRISRVEVLQFILKNLSTKKIHLKTNLEAVAPNEICICNTYIPYWHDCNLEDFKNLIDQLPKPFILIGDFHSHNQL